VVSNSRRGAEKISARPKTRAAATIAEPMSRPCGLQSLAQQNLDRRAGGLIQEADTVVFVISPEAIKSERCHWEVDKTVELSKRLLPVIFKPVPDAEIPQKLRFPYVRLGWVCPVAPGAARNSVARTRSRNCGGVSVGGAARLRLGGRGLLRGVPATRAASVAWPPNPSPPRRPLRPACRQG
jgi:hypothetical protein